MKHCKTCTCREVLLNAAQLLNLLSSEVPHREVYRGDRSQRWFVTHGSGEVDPYALEELIRDGRIAPVYNNTRDAWHIGKTLDLDATVAARRAQHGRKRKDGRLDIYTDGTQQKIVPWP